MVETLFVVESILFMRGDDEVTTVRAVTRQVKANDATDAVRRFAASVGGEITQLVNPSHDRATAIMAKGDEMHRLVAFARPEAAN